MLSPTLDLGDERRFDGDGNPVGCKSSEAVTVTVAAAAGTGTAVAADFTQSGTTTLTIAADATTEHRHGDGDRERERCGFAEQVGDGVGDCDGRQRCREPVRRDADPGGRRCPADGVAGAVADLDCGNGRGCDGDGGVVGSVERNVDGDGGRGGGGLDGGGVGGLHPEHGDDADHRGGLDGQCRDGDGDRRAQRCGCGGQVGDGVGGRRRAATTCRTRPP